MLDMLNGQRICAITIARIFDPTYNCPFYQVFFLIAYLWNMIVFHYTRHLIITALFSIFILQGVVNSQSATQQIEALLSEQSDAWNKGDIEGFMDGYLQTEDLHFLGSSGLTAGWHATLDRYKEHYPNQQTMGQLTFDLKEITKRTRDVYTVIGKFHLSRQELDDLEGYFLIVLQKVKGNWKIVADSTH